MDDSLTYTGIERALAERRIQRKAELVLSALRAHLLKASNLSLPNSVTIPAPCAILAEEMPALFAVFEQHGWKCRVGDGDLCFSKFHPQQ